MQPTINHSDDKLCKYRLYLVIITQVSGFNRQHNLIILSNGLSQKFLHMVDGDDILLLMVC